MISLEQAVSMLNPFDSGDPSFDVNCRGNKPRLDLLPSSASLRLIFPNQAWVDLVAERRDLRALWIDRPSAKNLEAIACLQLDHFSVSYPSHVHDWRFLSKLWGLRHLRVVNATSLTSLEPIADLVHLRVLLLSGPYSRVMKIPSLKPLSHLTELRVIALAAVSPQDWSLAPLHGMPHLEYFSCPKACPRAELEALQARNPKLDLLDDVQ